MVMLLALPRLMLKRANTIGFKSSTLTFLGVGWSRVNCAILRASASSVIASSKQLSIEVYTCCVANSSKSLSIESESLTSLFILLLFDWP